MRYPVRFAAVVLALLTLTTASLPLRAAASFHTETASFAIAFAGETSAYRELSAFVMPGTPLSIEAVGGPAGDYVLSAEQGDTMRRGSRAWRWRAPATPGLYTITVKGPGDKKDAIALHAFVMVPATAVHDGVLNGYRIGAYPPARRGPLYEPPPGFVEVTRENAKTRVSPHFRLQQFVCKEDGSDRYPKYLVLQPRLPLKLEAILERVNQLGFVSDTLHVMSGYRTPYYNHAIGDVPYSMHQWGSAADIYVDPAGTGRMEDLNGDHRVDLGDARYLYEQIERMLSLKPYERFQGGMGFYPATPAHPPFVHVDVRGTKARWRG